MVQKEEQEKREKEAAKLELQKAHEEKLRAETEAKLAKDKKMQQAA